jgi:hypothetical protein
MTRSSFESTFAIKASTFGVEQLGIFFMSEYCSVAFLIASFTGNIWDLEYKVNFLRRILLHEHKLRNV